MALTILTNDEALEAMRSARERARQRIEQDPDDTTKAVRMALLDSNGGYGYLRHKLAAFEHIDRGLLTLLDFAGVEYLWQLCTRRRSELATIEAPTWEGPLFNDDELDQIAMLLKQFDLDFVPE